MYESSCSPYLNGLMYFVQTVRKKELKSPLTRYDGYSMIAKKTTTISGNPPVIDQVKHIQIG